MKISINKSEMTAFVWQFSNIVSEAIPFSINQVAKLESDINIGIDNAKRSFFLEKLEFLFREEDDAYIEIELTSPPIHNPRHLDDKDEYIRHSKVNCKYLEIRRVQDLLSYVHLLDDRVVFYFSLCDLNVFFRCMYVNFEIHAMEYENTLRLLSEDKSGRTNSCDLVIWGVIEDEIIYY